MVVESERLNCQGFAASDRRGHGFGGYAQHVGVRIAGALIQERGANVELHAAGIRVGGAKAATALAQMQTGGAQLRDLKEVSGADGEDELDLPRSYVHGAIGREFG